MYMYIDYGKSINIFRRRKYGLTLVDSWGRRIRCILFNNEKDYTFIYSICFLIV